MKTLKEILAVASISLSSLRMRAGSASVIVIGIAGVVAVLLSVLTMSTSLVRTMSATGEAGRAVVLFQNATSERGSQLSRAAVLTIASAPGVRKNAAGAPIISAEVITVATVPRRSDGFRTELVLRGVGPLNHELRPEIQLVSGRTMRSGFNEIIVGRGAQSQYAGLDIGNRIVVRGTQWEVVGTFKAGGNARESELITDSETLSSADQRQAFNSVTVLLDGDAAFAQFKDALTSNPSVSVSVLRETEYYEGLSKRLGNILSFIAYVVGSIMAVGATFGALNTMYTAVSTRQTEIATLRAIGYGPISIVCSILLEALLLACIGALAGAAIVWLIFNGNTLNARPGEGYQLVIELRLTGVLLASGIGWACLMGFIGGLLPALRAARVTVAQALRAT